MNAGILQRWKKWNDHGAAERVEKLRLALTGMGFRDGEARRAIAEVASKHEELPRVEQALREALLVLTEATPRV